MPEKFNNKYRIKSARLPTWDYGNAGMYFITICTKDRKHFFGKVINGKMQLNELGKIVQTQWIKTFEIRADMNLQMGEFVVMPDHFHAIIIIGDNKYNTGNINFNHNHDHNEIDADDTIDPRTDAMHCVSATTPDDDPCTDAMHCVSSATTPSDDLHAATMPCASSPNKFGPQRKNLASIIRGFKSSVTTIARKKGNKNFGWQSRFHDHIIRDEKAFHRISQYIIDNPIKWGKK